MTKQKRMRKDDEERRKGEGREARGGRLRKNTEKRKEKGRNGARRKERTKGEKR